MMERLMAMRESQTYYNNKDDRSLDKTSGDNEENMEICHNRKQRKKRKIDNKKKVNDSDRDKQNPTQLTRKSDITSDSNSEGVTTRLRERSHKRMPLGGR